jgi:hypothetical protein
VGKEIVQNSLGGGEVSWEREEINPLGKKRIFRRLGKCGRKVKTISGQVGKILLGEGTNLC